MNEWLPGVQDLFELHIHVMRVDSNRRFVTTCPADFAAAYVRSADLMDVLSVHSV